MKKLAIGLQILLGLMFLGSAISKLTGGADDIRADLEIASWFWVVVAILEIVGAVALLASVRLPRLAVPAGLWFVAMMTGAIVSHLRVGEIETLFAPIILLAVALTIVAAHSNMFRSLYLNPLSE